MNWNMARRVVNPCYGWSIFLFLGAFNFGGKSVCEKYWTISLPALKHTHTLTHLYTHTHTHTHTLIKRALFSLFLSRQNAADDRRPSNPSVSLSVSSHAHTQGSLKSPCSVIVISSILPPLLRSARTTAADYFLLLLLYLIHPPYHLPTLPPLLLLYYLRYHHHLLLLLPA